MLEVINPCPKCESAENIGHQFMQAESPTGRCMAPRRCCRCGWFGPVMWPNGEALEWRPFKEPFYPVNYQRRLAQAEEVIQACYRALQKHGEWCGFRPEAPGDSSYNSAVEAVFAYYEGSPDQQGEEA